MLQHVSSGTYMRITNYFVTCEETESTSVRSIEVCAGELGSDWYILNSVPG
jgi:predicted acetyltransferase